MGRRELRFPTTFKTHQLTIDEALVTYLEKLISEFDVGKNEIIGSTTRYTITEANPSEKGSASLNLGSITHSPDLSM